MTLHYESSGGTYSYSLPTHLAAQPAHRMSVPEPHLARLAPGHGSEWRAADLCLVSSVSMKQVAPACAKDLYDSPWFRKARACVEAIGCPWYILSEKYGLIEPNATIEPYEKTLKTMRKSERCEWAFGVMKDLDPILAGVKSMTILAGERYREFLEPELRRRGITVHVPMRGMGIGEQLAWLGGQPAP